MTTPNSGKGQGATTNGSLQAAVTKELPDQDDHIASAPPLSLKQQKESLKDGKIVGFQCQKCKYERFSPMLRCPACKSSEITTREFSKTGKIVSYTIQSVASEAYLNETPFAFAVIKLDDGPQVSGWIPWISKPAELPLGQKVEYVPSYKPGMQFEKR